MIRKTLLATLLSLISFSELYGESFSIGLKPLTVKDNLVSNNIHDIYVEGYGVTWFAGEGGISRYDGYECFNYHFSTLVDSLESDTVLKIIPVEDNLMWLLTKSRQALEFNPHTGVVSLLDLKLPKDAGVNDVIPLPENKFYLGTTRGLYLFDKSTSDCTLQSYKKFYGENDSDSIRTLYQDKDGNIWIGSWGNGIFVIEQGGIRVNKIILDGIAPEAKVNEFIQSPSGHILAATWADGLLDISPNGSVVKKTAPIEKVGKGWDIIYSMCYDSDSNLLLGTPEGLWKINAGSGESCYTSYVNNNNVSELAEVFKIRKGDNSGIWMSLYERGVSQVMPPALPFECIDFSEGIGNRVNSLICDPHNPGLIWLGIQGEGAVLYNYEHRRFETVRFSKFTNIINQKANSIRKYEYCSLTDQLFIATRYDGLYIASYDGADISTLEKINLPKGMETRCGFMAVDSHGNAFVTLRSGGMFVAQIDPESKKHHFVPMDIDNLVNTAYVTSMIFDSEGNLLIGTENYGLLKMKLNYDSYSFQSIDSVRQIGADSKMKALELFRDSQDIVWIGTGHGLMRYDPKTGELNERQSRSNAHFPHINQISEDRYGNLWMSGTSYIIRYSPYSMNTANDYAFYRNSLVDAANGVISTHNSMVFIGGSNGVLFFDSAQMPVANNQVKPFVSDISVLNQSVLKKNIGTVFPYSHDLTVKHDENNLTIKFSANPYSTDNSYEYSYMMYPLEQEWQSAPVSQRSVTYSKLSPGDYVFRLRASNQSDRWSDEDYSINVHVKKAPWAMPWAIATYIVLGLAVLFLIVALIVKNERAERKRFREKLEGQKVTDIYNAKLSFLTNISHEIFTPITVMTCSLERLMAEDNQYRKSYLLMKANLKRIMRLMQQIMDFSKAESSKLSLKASFGDISKFIGNICNENFALDNSQSVKMEFSSYPESIVGFFDSEKLDKIMFNLISNAYKYNKPNGMIFVSVSRNDNRAVIKVRDTGYGIEPEVLPHIFELFNEGERRKHKVLGSGIGLSLTKELVAIHKGTVSVKSIVNQGTVFSVSIPIDAESYEIDEIEGRAELISVEAVEEDDNSLKTILIVEDNEELLMAMSSIIGTSFNVLIARDGSEALAISKEKMVDLILADYQMPNMNGEELCRAIRSDIRLSHIPLIIVSAYSSREYKLSAFSAGADAYVLKPFDTTLLLAQIRSIIANRQNISSNFEQSFFINISELSRNTLDTQFLERIVAYVKDHLSNPDSNQSLATSLNMSESSMYRKIKSITGMSPQEFMRKLRFKIACELLSDQTNNIADVAYKLGFTDPKYFSKCFKREFGMSPRDFIKEHIAENN